MGPQLAGSTGPVQDEEPPAIPARRDSLGKPNQTLFRRTIDVIKIRLYLVSESSVTSHQSSQPTKTNLSRQGSIVAAPPPAQQQNKGPLDDSEDTMKNLRKTFAGIFGEM